VKKKRSPVLWLVLAAVLLALGAWLMRGAEPPERSATPEVRMPTKKTREEAKQAEARRTWIADAPDAGVKRATARDPMLAMMPAEVKRGAVVAEFNAIMNSDLGQKLTNCLFDEGDLTWFRDAGVDPVNGIDRVAMIDNTAVVSGDFSKVAWGNFSESSKDYGPRAKIYEGGGRSFGVWNGQMLITGRDEGEIRVTLDRLENGGPQQGSPVLDESMAYGEVYGLVNSGFIASMMEKQDPRLAQLMRQTADSMQLHMDVTHDVGMVADVSPTDPKTADELRRALGAAVSLARMKATAEGDQDEAAILDLARVGAAGEGGGFRLEAGVPYEIMSKGLDECVAERARAKLRKADGGAPD
jgi:hypothetical protein